jgi:gluconate 2-dehydrogenase gamma chain
MSDEEQPRIISRRDLLRSAGLVGAAAVTVPAGRLADESRSANRPASPAAETSPSAQTTQAAARRQPYEHLTAAQADLLEAVVDRLIPSDEHGPGAIEAGVMRYIDRALGGALATSRPAYAAGLTALDQYAQASRGRPFLQLSTTDKDSVLIDVETGAARGFQGSSSQFFAMVLAHTRQGMFGDPYYGGNVNFAGWDLLGYPGVRTMVTDADQKAYEAGRLEPNHRSAYDTESFHKATVRHDGAPEDDTHGHQA